ncbi:hypothetical protein [Streptomyces sp. NPDC048002]
MPPTDRVRDHAGQGATTVAAHRARRRLRADRARQRWGPAPSTS